MPRKLHEFGESAPMPERPGSGEPRSAKERALARMAETKANIAAGRELAKAEMQRRQEAPKVLPKEKEEGIDPLRADRMKRDALLLEKTQLQERMQEMGGVWGGESYFILNDRLEEIERAVRKMDTGSEKRPIVSLPATEASFVAGEPTAADRVTDARKTLKQMKRYEHDIEVRQKKLQTELARYGIRSPAQIDAELAELSPELREASAGAKPGLWFNLRKMARGLAGMERPPEVKELLKKYVDLETEMNGEIHHRREAELALESAEEAAGKTRTRRQAPLASVVEQPVFNVQQELAAVRALKMLEEEMQDDMMNFAGKKEDFTPEDMELYTEKLDSLKQRLNALDESAGDSEAAKNASHAARETYVQYRRQVSQGASAIVGQARTAGRGEPRPPSVIGQVTNAGGQFMPDTTRNVVQLSKMETADKQEQREQERVAAKERVNKDVQMYRSIKWRKELIDTINSEEAVRSAMHSIYEAYKKRVQDMMAKGELNLITGSPDPALDYTLDLYRLYARQANGKHLYDERICQTALEEINRVDELLGGQWDTERTTDRLVSALLSKKPTLTVAENDTGESELDESDLTEIDPELARDIEKIRANDKKMAAIELTRREPTTETQPETQIEIGPTLSVDQITARLKVAKSANVALYNDSRTAVGLYGRTIRPKDIAKQYELLVGMAKTGDAPAGRRIKKLYELLVAAPEVAPVPVVAASESTEPTPLVQETRSRSEEELEAIEEVEGEKEADAAKAWAGPSTSKPVVERRSSRQQAPRTPETKKKPRGPLTELEYAELEDSLNRRVLALGKKWSEVGPEVKHILTHPKRSWIEQYAQLYKEYRADATSKDQKIYNRNILDRVNKLLGISKPSELIVPSSQALNEALAKATKLAEKQRMAEQRKIKSAEEVPVKPASFGDDVIKSHIARNAMKEKKRNKKGV